MRRFIVHLVVSALILLLVAEFVPGISINGFGVALLGALALGFVNFTVRPVIVLLTLPLTFLTLGLFLIVINALMLGLAATLVPQFTVTSAGAAFVGAILLSLFNLVADAVLNPEKDE